jgi:hypothetical protein
VIGDQTQKTSPSGNSRSSGLAWCLAREDSVVGRAVIEERHCRSLPGIYWRVFIQLLDKCLCRWSMMRLYIRQVAHSIRTVASSPWISLSHYSHWRCWYESLGCLSLEGLRDSLMTKRLRMGASLYSHCCGWHEGCWKYILCACWWWWWVLAMLWELWVNLLGLEMTLIPEHGEIRSAMIHCDSIRRFDASVATRHDMIRQ